ncbi:MAG: division/cell wall cluster transcriptional repressor MraZ [Calditrichota bacterium]
MPTREGLPFLGHFPGLIDDKGRLSIPADFRHALPPESDGMVVLTPGSSSFLNAFPLNRFNAVWEKADSDVLGFASSDSLARDTALLSEAVYRQFDSQGRITVPQSLLKAAGIGREVVFMGRWNHFIIWDTAAFETYRKTQALTPGDAWKRLIDQTPKA